MPRPTRRPSSVWRIALAAAVCAGGCAGLPRIDPSGRRILIWPDPAPPAPTTPGLGGNLDVPPVFAGGQSAIAPPSPAPTSGQGLAAAAPAATTALSPADEQLTITPTRLLAPVGSEVVLKAGVCNQDGYLRTNRRIEWMLGQEGAGQFVTVGERGELDFMRLPWERPNKVDNAYAVGYTAPFHTCIRRGTDDSSDDVQVRPGEAWITLTSASEGVSYVTATAPGSSHWDARRATATVYWVDAQWRLPAPLALQPGQTGTLTTTVTRKSDGAPVAGWIVRYEAAPGSSARLGYESGHASEATTDAQGRASVRVTPTDDQPGGTPIRVTVIRPATSAPMPSPRLELGGGDTSVTWTPSATVPLASPVAPSEPAGGGAPAEPRPPAPFEPPPRVDGGATVAPPVPGVGPRVELKLTRSTVGAVRVGDPVPITIELVNTGDEAAQNLRLAVDYDRGLSSPQDTQGRFRLERADLPDLGPGDSSVVDLDFTAAAPGEACYSVSLSADRMPNAFERECLTVEQAPPPARPQLRIQTAIDAVREVGQTLTYLVTVYNDAPSAAEGVAVEVLTDPALEAAEATDGSRVVPRGLRWEGETIPAGGSLQLQVVYNCVAPSDEAKVTVYALLSETDYQQKTDAVEVRPARVPGAAPLPPAPAGDLEGVVSSNANPATVGQPAVLNVAVTNRSGRALENVQYRLRLDRQIQPSSVPGASFAAGVLDFPPIPSLAPGATFRSVVPYTPVEQGVATVYLDLRVGATGSPTTAQQAISIRPR